MIIDCNDCEMFESDQCRDCFVMAVLSRGDGPVVIEPEEEKAIANLQDAGLAPVLKFREKPAEGAEFQRKGATVLEIARRPGV